MAQHPAAVTTNNNEKLISLFKEDNVFSITASLPYGPPVNTDIIIRLFSDFFIFASVAKLVV